MEIIPHPSLRIGMEETEKYKKRKKINGANTNSGIEKGLNGKR